MPSIGATESYGNCDSAFEEPSDCIQSSRTILHPHQQCVKILVSPHPHQHCPFVC